MRIFGIDELSFQTVDQHGRFKRPFSVAILGSLMSIALTVLRALEPGVKGNVPSLGVILFACFAIVFSCVYAYIGGRYSRALANRILGIVGGAIALGGVAYVVWLVRFYAPR